MSTAIRIADPAWRSPLGNATLYQANSLEVMKDMPEASVDCVWTDPPYFLSNGGVTCVSGRMVSVDKGEWDRSNGIEQDHEFNRSWLRACLRILKPTGTIWVSGTQHIYFSIGMALVQEGYRILNDIVWEKPAPPPNLGCRCFTHSTEMIIWASKAPKGSRDKYTFNYEAMKEENGGKQMKNVWRLGAVTAVEKQFGKHPTQKPLAVVERCLRAATNLGDTVFDPFAGSSTTGVAALRLGRRYVGCEVKAEYVRLSQARLAAADVGVNRGYTRG